MKQFILKITNRLLIMLAVAGLFILGSCGDDDEEFVPTQTIWQIVEERDNLSLFEQELVAAGLNDELAADGSMTLFAPSNDALGRLLETLELTDFSSVSTEIVQAVLSYHIANQQILADQLTAGATFTTLQGEQIAVGGGPVLETGASADAGFDETNILATNGVVHVVDVVLVPPTIGDLIVQTLGTVAQPILLAKDFSILKEGLMKADGFAQTAGVPTLLSILVDSEIKTVFAPTNATFNAGGITAGTFTGQQWYGIIANHIVAGDNNDADSDQIINQSEMTTGATFTTKAGGTLQFFNDTAVIPPQNGLGIYIDSNGDVNLLDATTYGNFDAEVAMVNVVEKGNGVIHVIAGVLSPQ